MQPLVLPDLLAENPVASETLGSDGDSPSQVICRTRPRFLKSKVEFHNLQVGASCDNVAEAGPALCSLKVPEVLPPRSTGPPSRIRAPKCILHYIFCSNSLHASLKVSFCFIVI